MRIGIRIHPKGWDVMEDNLEFVELKYAAARARAARRVEEAALGETVGLGPTDERVIEHLPGHGEAHARDAGSVLDEVENLSQHVSLRNRRVLLDKGVEIRQPRGLMRGFRPGRTRRVAV